MAAAAASGVGVLGALRAADAPPRYLVVVELAGGNDGFNTLVPYLHEPYYRLRPTLALPRQQLLPVSDGFGLNPALRGLHRLWELGYLGVLQGLGARQPERSNHGDVAHQLSRDALHCVWGGVGDRPASGWMARAQELMSSGQQTPSWAVSLDAPDDGPLLGSRALLSARPMSAAGYGDVLGFPSVPDEVRSVVLDKLLSVVVALLMSAPLLRIHFPGPCAMWLG